MVSASDQNLSHWLSQLSISEVQDMINVIATHKSDDDWRYRESVGDSDDTWSWMNDGWQYKIAFELNTAYDAQLGYSLYSMVMIDLDTGNRVTCFTDEDAYSAIQVLEFVRDNDACEQIKPREHYGSW